MNGYLAEPLHIFIYMSGWIVLFPRRSEINREKKTLLKIPPPRESGQHPGCLKTETVSQPAKVADNLEIAARERERYLLQESRHPLHAKTLPRDLSLYLKTSQRGALRSWKLLWAYFRFRYEINPFQLETRISSPWKLRVLNCHFVKCQFSTKGTVSSMAQIKWKVTLKDNIVIHSHIPVNTKHLYNICTTLAQRGRPWADVVQMLYVCYTCFVFTGISYINSICDMSILHKYLYFSSFKAGNCARNSSFKWRKIDTNNSEADGLMTLRHTLQRPQRRRGRI